MPLDDAQIARMAEALSQATGKDVQVKAITDPDVINEFATLVRDQAHLDYLYVLTVADVRGTNPRLWNSWKATLFHDLYELTARALRRGLENPLKSPWKPGPYQEATPRSL